MQFLPSLNWNLKHKLMMKRPFIKRSLQWKMIMRELHLTYLIKQ